MVGVDGEGGVLQPVAGVDGVFLCSDHVEGVVALDDDNPTQVGSFVGTAARDLLHDLALRHVDVECQLVTDEIFFRRSDEEE